jgi:hypothetical protein
VLGPDAGLGFHAPACSTFQAEPATVGRSLSRAKSAEDDVDCRLEGILVSRTLPNTAPTGQASESLERSKVATVEVSIGTAH